MVKLGILNSRMKDFYDIRVLSDVFSFNGELLVKAIKSTFKNRDTEIPDVPMFMQNSFRVDPQKQIQWKAFIRKTGLEDNTADFNDTIRIIEIFIKPVLSSIIANKLFSYEWAPRGPWEFVQ